MSGGREVETTAEREAGEMNMGLENEEVFLGMIFLYYLH